MLNNAKTIPIVLASDKNYAGQLYVAIKSILMTKNKETSIRFYVLTNKDYGLKNKLKIKFLCLKYPRVKLSIIDMPEWYDSLHIGYSHTTTATYYRMSIPDILPMDCNKCLYLDTDIIAKKDLSELYDIDIEDYYAAGVVAANYHIIDSFRKYSISIGIDDPRKYINAGVMLLNLKSIRNDGIKDMMIEHSKKDYKSADQDVINLVMKGKIKTIPMKYNVMPIYAYTTDEHDERHPIVKEIYGESEIKEAFTDPVIIHYASRFKPWNTKDVPLQNEWWNVANKTSYRFDEFKKEEDSKNNV